MRHFILLCLLAMVGTLHAAEVELFTPQGEVKAVRQVAVRFTEDVVPFGDPRLPSPFAVQCLAKGAARWVDARNWSYDFEQDLDAGLNCRFSVKADFRDLKGQPLTGTQAFTFNTGGPAIRASLPGEGEWNPIDEKQVFILSLDVAATPASIEKNAACEVDGIGERIPLRVVQGEERTKILAQRRLLGYQYLSLLILRDSDGELIASGTLQSKKELDVAEQKLAVVQCRRTLPNGREVTLVWGAGIATASGIATPEAQRLGFKVRDDFNARFSCQRANTDADCLPMLDMGLQFSAPIKRELAQQIRLTAANGTALKPQAMKEARVEGVSFKGPFPERTTYRLSLPAELRDDAGRRLSNADRFPLQVRTDEAPPLAKFSGQFGILEWKEGGVLPVSLRNLDGDARSAAPIAARKLRITDEAQIRGWTERISKTVYGTEPDYRAGIRSVFGAADQPQNFTVAKPLGAREFEVAPIPLKEPGLYVVELESPRLGAALHDLKPPVTAPYFVPTMALVTDMAVHFQWGRESSSVWVTRLHDGSVVADARVKVINHCDGKLLWEGRTGKDGLARISADLPAASPWSGCGGYGAPDLLVSARSGSDFSYVLSSWSEGIAPGNFGNIPTDFEDAAPSRYHAVLDRALYRAGETVSMKHVLRETRASGFAVPQKKPAKLVIAHQGSGKTFELPLVIDAGGIGETQWTIPKDAPLGLYRFDYDGAISGGQFRVEQFQVPAARAQIQPPKSALIAARDIALDLQVSYLAGGGASGLPVKLRTQVRPRSVQFRHYEEYRFGGDEVKPGLIEESNGGWFPEFDERGELDNPQSRPAQTLPLTLDAQGAARAKAPLTPARSAQELVAEMEYADPNGQILTVSRRVPLWPSAIALGLKTDGWVAQADDLPVTVAVLDTAGQPVRGRSVSVEIFQREVHSYRKRLLGGFYTYASTRKTRKLPGLCAKASDELGLVQCRLAPGVSGEILIQARSVDRQNRPALSVTSAWVAGKDDWWFEQQANDRMDVLPEKKEYSAHDTARLQVRMPFRSATALVTVAREGVIEQFVTTLQGDKPVIEVPLKGSYAPNVFVSVLALRGRPGGDWWQELAGKAKSMLSKFKPDQGAATSLTDLARPSFRYGVAQLNVGWEAHRLSVEVTPDKPVYEIREKARIRIRARTADGTIPANAEIAVAAVDEALLELQPNESWKLLEAMMAPRGLAVLTATAQMQVVGKRQYGRKTAPPGGGGGQMNARELFDTLLLWKGRVRLDANGEAKIDVPLNDSLSSFRIVAVASTADDRYGTGSVSIRTHQNLQLISALPAVVREGDRFRASFTVRNASTETLKPTLVATLQGQALKEQTLEIPAGSARDATWEVDVPPNLTELVWDVRATSATAKDALKLRQTVTAAYPVRVYQATLTQVGAGGFSMQAERPVDAIPGRGGIRVELMDKLGGSMSGVRDYMSRYPWNCMEQRLSRAIALGDDTLWQSVKADMPVYLDADGLLKFYPSAWLEGSDALTAYALSITHEAEWEIPQDAREKMLAALDRFARGQLQRGNRLNRADQVERKLAALEALSRYGRAKAEVVNALEFQPNLLPTSALLGWMGVLQRVPDVREGAARLAQAQQILRSRINLQGTVMTFSTERDDAWWWLMASADRNANIAVLRTLNEVQWQSDLPRLWRGAWLRQQRGHWDTTLANAWGVLAARRFAEKFEREPVAGVTRAVQGEQQQRHAWTAPTAVLDFAWPAATASFKLQHEGTGAPWAIVQSRASLPLKEPLSTGYRVSKTMTRVEGAAGKGPVRGDVWRVKLDIDAQSDMTWVAVDDPVPPGSLILGSGLGGDSARLSQGDSQQGNAWLAYVERRQDSYRAYYEFVPKGRFSIEYTVRLNTPGTFQLPATRVEAMYAPEMFAERPNLPISVSAE